MEEQGDTGIADVAPRTITGKPHRPAYGSDGDYFSKAQRRRDHRNHHGNDEE